MIRKLALTAVLLLLPAAGAVAGPLPDTGRPAAAVCCKGEDGAFPINPPAYVKLDGSGSPLPDDAPAWAMVHDKLTGLTWEIKTDTGDIHDRDDVYDHLAATTAFIQRLNANRFGGFSDWRLPEVKELVSISDKTHWLPAIDKHYFPGTEALDYWTATADGADAAKAWRVHFCRGYVNSMPATDKYRVRAVRGPCLAHARLVDNGDGTVTDTSTGLMWQQAVGPRLNWRTALAYAEFLETAGYRDWRLPNAHELLSIIDWRASAPAVDTRFFPGTPADVFWSSTFYASSRESYAPDQESAWIVDFASGALQHRNQSQEYFCRTVRGGQTMDENRIYITQPAQGSAVSIGSRLSIRWETRGIDSPVSIRLSRNSDRPGRFSETIAAKTENDGLFEWTVTGPPSPNCAIQVRPLLRSRLEATVQSLFSIVDQ